MWWLVSGCSTFKGRASPTFWDPPVPSCVCDSEARTPMASQLLILCCSVTTYSIRAVSNKDLLKKAAQLFVNCTKRESTQPELGRQLCRCSTHCDGARRWIRVNSVLFPFACPPLSIRQNWTRVAVGVQKVPLPLRAATSHSSTWQDLMSKLSLSAVFQGVKNWLILDLKIQKVACDCSHNSLLGKSDSLSPFP